MEIPGRLGAQRGSVGVKQTINEGNLEVGEKLGKPTYSWKSPKDGAKVEIQFVPDRDSFTNDIVVTGETVDSMKGKGIATELFLMGLEDSAKRWPNKSFRSESILSSGSLKLYERLKNAGLPITKSGSEQFPYYEIKKESLKRIDFDSIRRKLQAQAVEFQKGPVFYSPTIKAVETLPDQTVSREQWINTLKNRPGVKAEELDWYNLENLPEKASKAEVLNYLKSNELTVETKILGGMSNEESVQLSLLDSRLRAGLRLSPEEQAQYNELTSRESLGKTSGLATKYGNQKNLLTPGGENYREVLLKLPVEHGEGSAIAKEIRALGWKKSLDDISASQIEALGGSRDLQNRWMNAITSGTFRGSHFDEPNVLAHARVNDRTTVNGDRTLFVEEIQSDWHQKARDSRMKEVKRIASERGVPLPSANSKPTPEYLEIMREVPEEYGYKSSVSEDKSKIPPGYELVNDVDRARSSGYDVPENSPIQWMFKGPNSSSRLYTSREQAIAEAWIEVDLKNQLKVPDAPFKTSWPELTLKRLIRMAAEENKDSISWTTGEMQAARYDLSKQVDSIEVGPRINAATGEVTRSVRITMPGGQVRDLGVDAKGIVDNVNKHDIADWKGKNLEDVIGKEMAEKIMSTEGKKEFSGLDLKVGGEGMKAFYDKMLVNTANKLGKKYGAKVEEVEIAAGEDSSRIRELNRQQNARGVITNISPEDVVKKTKVNSLKITPEMKKAALAGQPIAAVYRPSDERVA
jgi:hypothetical protein